MLIKSSAFYEGKLNELFEIYVNDVDDCDRIKSEVILLNSYLDNRIVHT